MDQTALSLALGFPICGAFSLTNPCAVEAALLQLSAAKLLGQSPQLVLVQVIISPTLVGRRHALDAGLLLTSPLVASALQYPYLCYQLSSGAILTLCLLFEQKLGAVSEYLRESECEEGKRRWLFLWIVVL